MFIVIVFAKYYMYVNLWKTLIISNDKVIKIKFKK